VPACLLSVLQQPPSTPEVLRLASAPATQCTGRKADAFHTQKDSKDGHANFMLVTDTYSVFPAVQVNANKAEKAEHKRKRSLANKQRKDMFCSFRDQVDGRYAKLQYLSAPCNSCYAEDHECKPYAWTCR
jgi:hypothetical protein